MMELAEEDLRLVEVFRQKAANARQEIEMRAFAQIHAEGRRRHEHELREEAEARQFAEALATPAQLMAFNSRLDDYDTATVHALMDNQHKLDRVLKQREEIEASAYRLPDGRMAFKTEDRRHVFDQHGAELKNETIHPEAIPDGAPSWEAKRRIDTSEEKLNGERDKLHVFQNYLDETREAANKGEVTEKALAKMEADLKLEMPSAVQQQLSSSKLLVDGPDPTTVAATIAPKSTHTALAGTLPSRP